MRLIIDHPPENPVAGLFPHGGEPQDRVYRMSVRSFGFSTLFHLVVLTALYFSESLITPPNRPVYETVIEPNKTKLVWYRLKTELPNIDSPDSVEKKSTRGLVRSPRILIADSKHGSKSEFVWQKSPSELPKEVKAPNLIALHSAAPAPPSPAPPAPAPPVLLKLLRAFVPPTEKPQVRTAQAAPDMLPAPTLNLPTNRVTLPAAMPIKVAAAPVNVPTAPVMLPAPTIKTTETSVVLPAAPPTAAVAPPPAVAAHAEPAAGSRSGNLRPEVSSTQPPGEQNVASINLDSAPSRTLPPGRRAGEFSTAPQTGDSPGSTKGTGALVPGLTTRGRNPGDSEIAMKVPAMTPTLGSTIAYRDIMSHPMGSSLSAPLRPGSRTVPARVEQKFHDRPVYTMVIPAPRLPEYAADWILWFSERVAPAEGVVQIHGPVPEKKHISATPQPAPGGTEGVIQISGVIDESGHMQEAAILKIPVGFPAQFALSDLAMWQFKPATRNGVPIAVEVLLDIAFRRH